MSDLLSLSVAEVIYWQLSGVMLVSIAATCLLMRRDTRTIDGSESVWMKPLRFQVSLAIYSATLALFLMGSGVGQRHSSIMSIVSAAFLASSLFEIGYIQYQASRAQRSHFNVSSSVHRAMFAGMALGAIIISGAAAAIGIEVAFDASSSFSPPVKRAVVGSSFAATLLMLITGFAIGANRSPYVGSMPNSNERMTVTGWSRSGGDLRVSHFLATHLIQIAPAFALAIEQLIDEPVAVIAVDFVLILSVLVAVQELMLALKGRPSSLLCVVQLFGTAK